MKKILLLLLLVLLSTTTFTQETLPYQNQFNIGLTVVNSGGNHLGGIVIEGVVLKKSNYSLNTNFSILITSKKEIKNYQYNQFINKSIAIREEKVGFKTSIVNCYSFFAIENSLIFFDINQEIPPLIENNSKIMVQNKKIFEIVNSNILLFKIPLKYIDLGVGGGFEYNFTKNKILPTFSLDIVLNANELFKQD
jgi:hypothetical protein